jgi:catechol 2,3-dioxygenase
MADAGRRHADEDLVRAGVLDVDALQAHRKPNPPRDRGRDFHADRLPEGSKSAFRRKRLTTADAAWRLVSPFNIDRSFLDQDEIIDYSCAVAEAVAFFSPWRKLGKSDAFAPPRECARRPDPAATVRRFMNSFPRGARMPLPSIVLDPPFNITRASHIVLTVADLAGSRVFYEEVIGLVVTLASEEALYFRGVEEACHHSLVLRKSAAAPVCSRVGLRVLTDADLIKAHGFFAQRGCSVEWAEVAHQGKTLHVVDPFGMKLEFCSRMPVQPRQITSFQRHKGGCALRLDHIQLLTPHLRQALEFYMSLGFWLTEYVAPDDENIRAVFLQRKGNPHDLVFFHGDGPRMHHFAFVAAETHQLLRACDTAGELGFGAKVERGPGRHGPGHAQFVYFRDPDGHRVELFNNHYQVMDLENEPVRWDPNDPAVAYPWGMPARRRWFEQASAFEASAVAPASPKPNPMTLERFLSED